MRFETTPRFDRDWKSLPVEHRRLFRSLIPAFSAACDDYVRARGTFSWPDALRVRPMVSAPGIWEMTWSFSGPDGRATFEFVAVEEQPAVRWRRIGTHVIYRTP